MSRHKCTKGLYQAFLQASSVRYSGLALSGVSPITLSHDSISRWLNDQSFRPRELWHTVKTQVALDVPCLLIADDTILAKTHSREIDLVHYQYSGNVHDVIAGIGLINLLWHELDAQQSIPIDYRIYDKDSDGKTKNTHFCDMLSLAKQRGLSPDAVVVDAWYSSLKNLKAIREHGWVFVAGLKKNRIVNRGEHLADLMIPDAGLKVHLRGYGWVWVFKFVAKHGRVDYIITNMANPTRLQTQKIMQARWAVEVYHRELKQTCGIERCQSRTGRAQRNHIWLAIMAWFKQYQRRLKEKISFYEQNWQVIKSAIATNIKLMLAMP